MSAIDPFWMVVNVQSGICGGQIDCGEKIPSPQRPSYLHDSREKAEVEALRLRRKYQGFFVVLEAVSYADEGVQTTCGMVHRIQSVLP